jgi:hypothetical protein
MKIDDIVLDIRLRRYRSVFHGLESFLDGSAAEAKQHFRYAFFLRYYAIFESQLKVLCDRFAEEMSLPLRLSDINGENFLKRVNKYLTRVGHFDPLHHEALWEDILSYQWIRNLIIHNDGQMANGQEIPQFVSKQFERKVSALRLTSKSTIRLNRGFCYRAVSKMAALLLKMAKDGSSLTDGSTERHRIENSRTSLGWHIDTAPLKLETCGKPPAKKEKRRKVATHVAREVRQPNCPRTANPVRTRV